jgi:hypothetical protein
MKILRFLLGPFCRPPRAPVLAAQPGQLTLWLRRRRARRVRLALVGLEKRSQNVEA